MASRRLTDLDRFTYPLAENFVCKCENAGIDILVYCTYRSCQEQEALYAQGRYDVCYVNDLRVKVGLGYVDSEENKHKVTFAKPGESYHQKRRAFDCVPMTGGKCVWSRSSPIWKKLGEIGDSVGLEWAGTWKRFKEFPHFQLC